MKTLPVPDEGLVAVIVEATRSAITQLRTDHPDDFCVYALLTCGEAFRPYLTVTVRGANQWDLADSPYAVFGEEWMANTAPAYDARPPLFEMTDEAAAREYNTRLASMEEALRRLDQECLFGVGEARAAVILLVSPMPPDESDAQFARRLNPSSPLLDAWLAEAAEGS